MSILVHLLTSAILALLLFFYFGWHSLLIFVGGVLIDIDHYLNYILKFKKIDILKSYFYFRGKEYFGMFCAFHSFELFIMLLILSFFSEAAMFITIGLFTHYVLDFIYEFNLTGRLIKNWSLISWLRKKAIAIFIKQ